MNKKTKLWLGAGIVGVGAYLLWKSKKATTPAVTAPANLVGFNAVGDRMISAEGSGFAGVGQVEKFGFNAVGDRMISAEGAGYAGVGNVEKFGQDGSQFFDVKGGHVGIPDADVFKKAVGEKMPLVGKMNQTGESAFKHVVLKGNKPKPAQDTTAKKAAQLVGANGAPTFFSPRTARFGKDQGIFAAPKRKATPVMDEPVRKSPVEPVTPMPVTQAAPKNNMVGLINGPVVHGTNW